MINCTQLYYTMAMDEPGSRLQFFSEKQDVDELKQSVQPGDSISYVSSITYGKRIVIVAETTDSTEQTRAAVDANVQLPTSGASVSAQNESKQVLRGSKYKVFAAGASPDDVRLILGTPRGSAAPEITPIFAQESQDKMVTYGAPLAYTVNFLNNAKPMRLALVGDYTVPVYDNAKAPLIQNAVLRLAIRNDDLDHDSSFKVFNPDGQIVINKTGAGEQDWSDWTERSFSLGNVHADRLTGTWRVVMRANGNDRARFQLKLLANGGAIPLTASGAMQMESRGHGEVTDYVALNFGFERKFDRACVLDSEEEALAAEFKERVDGSKQ
jgi:hypothetical protein